MKHFTFLKSLLLLCALVVGSVSVWADEVKETLTITGWGSYTSNSYSSSGSDYTGSGSVTGVTYAMQVFKGDNGQPRGNQSSAASNFSCRNTTTYSGYYVKKIQLIRGAGTGTFDGASANRSVVYFGTSAYDSPSTTTPSGTSTASTENASGQTTLTWENTNTNVTYFLLYHLKTSGSPTSCTIEITWESASSTSTPTISVDPTSLSGFTYIEGNGPSTTKTFSVSGSDLTANIGLSLGDNSNYEMSTAANGTYTNSLSLTQSSGSVAATDIYVRLKSGLTKAANYAGTITLSSTDAESVEVSLSGSVTGQIYDVNVATGLTGGSIGADPTSAEAGETISLTATPNAEYTFGSWSVYKHGDQSTTVTVTNNQFTMPAYDVDVTATFTAKPKHTATFSVNGVTSSQMYAEDADITFPSNPADINGKSFVGWATATISGTTNTAPSPLVTSATMGTSDITFYAVFALTSGGVETVTLTASHTTNSTSYGDHEYTDDNGLTWSGNTNEPYESSVARIGLRNTSGSYLESPTFPGNVTSVVIKTYNGSGSDRYFYLKSTKDGSNDLGSVKAPKNEQLTAEHSAELTGTAFNKFFIVPSGAVGFSYIKVTYSDITVSNYCTTVLSEVEVTITDNKYATFSSDYKLDFSNTGVKAYKATTNTNSSVHLEEVTVVPANTGVLLYSETADDYTIPVSTETASNMSGNKLVSTANGAHNVTAEEYEKAYVFGKLNDEVGFFKAAEGKTVAQGRCYLLLDEAISLSQDAPFLSIIFDEGATTKINLNDNDNLNFDENAPQYNMSGQRVSNSYKGIVIVNGKKVVRK